MALALERPRSRGKARVALTRWIEGSAFPAWEGTGWDFNGTTQTPGAGLIACGYYVSTVLRHGGVLVERVRLAQQASEFIVKTLASNVEDFAGTPAEAVARALARGEGLYLVGLDFHVGFLRVEAGRVDFCHSSYLGTKAVLCERSARRSGLPLAAVCSGRGAVGSRGRRLAGRPARQDVAALIVTGRFNTVEAREF